MLLSGVVICFCDSVACFVVLVVVRRESRKEAKRRLRINECHVATLPPRTDERVVPRLPQA